MSVIILDRVVKTYPNGTRAVKDIDLAIEPGHFTVILGPSGAGKSTLLRLMNGLEKPSEGTVSVHDTVLGKKNLRAIRREVGMVFQQFNLVGRLNVMTNVLTGRLAYRSWLGSVLHLFREEDFRIAQAALARVDLTEKAWVRADQLSGGQQQRVGIARALAQRPRVILADEPVASLDPLTSREVLDLLKGICQDDHIPVVANLHQVDYAREYADRVIGVNSGRVVFDGSPDQLTDAMVDELYQRAAPVKEPLHEASTLAHA
ncbi:phosphonate ABC transporter ATP-binding protein [Ectothiorhodospira mobilis]|uniref:phosphonate ABC transporter ATP-binding protein n=1 Tax=Ectothiorhodospira mobilis TaxID=195064 RepID=UPI001EE829F8|nr:phosphonate ABC transporter ATP-binding protein [Ectothiorhodospira mobilis]MCG5536804.1 phosphonate ABC transporter ATP-binding protein [Ectothiorhodospira mobilis]